MAMLIDAGVHYNTNRRIITIGEVIEPMTSTNFEHALGKILLTNAQKPIIVFLQGKKGGDLHACLKIYELIDACNAPIYTVAVDVVFSGFFYILQGGKKRFATPKTKLIFHRSTLCFKEVDMNADGLHKEAEFLLMCEGLQLALFCKRGRPIKRILELFRKGSSLSAAKAKKMKLVDTVIPKSTLDKMSKQILKRVSINQK